MNFWTRIIINEALTFAQIAINSGHLNDVQKAALTKFIEDGRAMLALF